MPHFVSGFDIGLLCTAAVSFNWLLCPIFPVILFSVLIVDTVATVVWKEGAGDFGSRKCMANNMCSVFWSSWSSHAGKLHEHSFCVPLLIHRLFPFLFHITMGIILNISQLGLLAGTTRKHRIANLSVVGGW